MTTIKAYTDLEHSKKLAEILPLESTDMHYKVMRSNNESNVSLIPYSNLGYYKNNDYQYCIPCWSLAALLKYLSEIKPQVYTPILFPSENKWILQFAEYSHGNVCEVSYDNPIDACVEMIIKLHELNLL